MYSTQQHLKIEDIRDDLVILKDGSVSLVLKTGAVNFELLSEEEQLSIIEAFAGLLNSLSFPIQVVIRSKRLDVSLYLKTLDRLLTTQTNPKLKTMITYYRQFVASLIKENEVLDKQFYVCLNLTSVEVGVLNKNSPAKIKKAITILAPRRDHIVRQLNRLGIKTRQLTTVELIKLFYDIYNNPFSDIANLAQTPVQPQTKSGLAQVTPPEGITTPVQNPNRQIPITPPTTPKITPPPPQMKQSFFVPPLQVTPPAGYSRLTPPFIVEELVDEYAP